jgi:hypothetical protein
MAPAHGTPELVLPVAHWCAWGLESTPSTPDVAFIEPALRRRLSPLARSALAVAEAVRPHGSPVRFVFASRHGELKRNAEMLQELADGQSPSPMNFSLSVLNAVSGLFGITHRDRSASSAVSAGRDTVPLALLEGAVQAWLHPDESVLVVCADEPPPELYARLVDEPDRPYALAVLLSARGATLHVRTTWTRPSGEAPTPSAATAFVDCVERRRAVHWTTADRSWTWEPQSPTRH